ncbi:MAG: MFS transporter [Candidatus Sungbacteria bacterium]|nr:MFS transporter [Candidatus Sungbacteria bacterium]
MVERLIQFGSRTFSSLRVWNYRLYFFGQALSLCGTWMQTIAQSWLVLKLTGSGTALGLITALQFLPILFFGPWGGVIADRYPKRKILYVTQTASGILALILGILVATDTVELWMVGVLALLLGLVNAVDNPTRQTFVTEMVTKEHFANAVSLNSMQVNLARAVGPAVGGVLIATVGLAWCFGINAVSYIAVLAVLFMMRQDELLMVPPVERKKGQLKEGIRYIMRSPMLRDTLIMLGIIGTLTYEFIVILPLFAKFTFGGDAGSYAALNSAMGIGSVFGGLFVAQKRKRSSRMLVNASVLLGSAMLLVALAPTFPMAIAGMVLVGIFSINFLSTGNVLLQMESAPEMRGRVMAFWAVAFLGSTPIGGPIIGWIGEYIGPRWGLATGGFAALAAAWFGFVRFGRKTARGQAV